MTISTSTEANKYSLIEISEAQNRIADTLATLEAYEKSSVKYNIQINNYLTSKSNLQTISLEIEKDINTNQMDPSTVPHAIQLLGGINTLSPSFEQLEQSFTIFDMCKNQLRRLKNQLTQTHSLASQITSDISIYQKIDIEKIGKVFTLAKSQSDIKTLIKEFEESQDEVYHKLIKTNSVLNELQFSALDLYRTPLSRSLSC